MTADLVDFLRARIDDDERTAQAATQAAWSPYRTGKRKTSNYVVTPDHKGVAMEYALVWEPGDAEHIARHDPARVLREVAAKRRLLNAHAVNCGGYHDYDEAVSSDRARIAGLDVALWSAIKFAAGAYSDHPEYRAEWNA